MNRRWVAGTLACVVAVFLFRGVLLMPVSVGECVTLRKVCREFVNKLVVF